MYHHRRRSATPSDNLSLNWGFAWTKANSTECPAAPLKKIHSKIIRFFHAFSENHLPNNDIYSEPQCLNSFTIIFSLKTISQHTAAFIYPTPQPIHQAFSSITAAMAIEQLAAVLQHPQGCVHFLPIFPSLLHFHNPNSLESYPESYAEHNGSIHGLVPHQLYGFLTQLRDSPFTRAWV